MNPEKSPELTVQALMALRKESDAVRVITERLKVKEMGPADHIRTKHEVKSWLECGGTQIEAEAIVKRAGVRRDIWQSQSIGQKITVRREYDQRLGP